MNVYDLIDWGLLVALSSCLPWALSSACGLLALLVARRHNKVLLVPLAVYCLLPPTYGALAAIPPTILAYFFAALCRNSLQRYIPQVMLLGSYHGLPAAWTLIGLNAALMFAGPHARCYSKDIRLNFPNYPNRVEVLQLGTTHIAMGFNDLALLCSSKFVGPCDGRKLKFIGVDQSAYSVAKGLVILQMLEDDSTPLGHILQVWYSSTWTLSALTSFKRAASAVVAGASSLREAAFGNPEPVLKYLQLWLISDPISVSAAHEQWLSLQNRKASVATPQLEEVIAILKRNIDRTTMLHYAHSGDFIFGISRQEGGIEVVVPETAEVGSLCMWCDTPEGSYGSPTQEFIFKAFSMSDLVQQWVAERQNGANIVQVLAVYVLKGIKSLRHRLCDLDVQLFCLEVDPADSSLAARFAALDARSVSWSNLMDYMEYSRFHDYARQVGQSAVHVGYSMEWMSRRISALSRLSPLERDARVLSGVSGLTGTSKMDNFTLYTGLDQLVEWRQQVTFSGHRALLVHANLNTYFSAMQDHRKWVYEQFAPDGINIGHASMDLWNPLQYGVQSTGAHMSWAYDLQREIVNADMFHISDTFRSSFGHDAA